MDLDAFDGDFSAMVKTPIRCSGTVPEFKLHFCLGSAPHLSDLTMFVGIVWPHYALRAILLKLSPSTTNHVCWMNRVRRARFP